MLNLSENSHTPRSYKMTSPFFIRNKNAPPEEGLLDFSRYDNNLKFEEAEKNQIRTPQHKTASKPRIETTKPAEIDGPAERLPREDGLERRD